MRPAFKNNYVVLQHFTEKHAPGIIIGVQITALKLKQPINPGFFAVMKP